MDAFNVGSNVMRIEHITNFLLYDLFYTIYENVPFCRPKIVLDNI